MKSTTEPRPFTPNYLYVESEESRRAAQPRPRAPTPTSLVARLGQVLAWTANIIAAAVLVVGATFLAVTWNKLSQENTPALVWQRDKADNWRFAVLERTPNYFDRFDKKPDNMFNDLIPETVLSINIVQAGLSGAIRYVLTGPVTRTLWRIWHHPAGEGASGDWALQQRGGPEDPWTTAAVYPTREAAEAAFRSVAR